MSKKPISDAARARMATYQAVLDRYSKTPDPCAAVLVAVRLLIHRRGYSQVLRQLQRKQVAWVAANVMAEFNELQVFIAQLLADYASDPAEQALIAEDLANLMADLHSEPGQQYMFRLLGRLKRRASWWFNTPAWAEKRRQDGERVH